MKLVLRTLLPVFAFGIVRCASAQDVNFKFVFADAAGAALNGKNVGDELGPTTTIGAIGSQLQISLVATSVKDATYSVGQAMICFDQRTVFHSGAYSTKAKFDADTIDKKLDIVSLPPKVDGIMYPLVTNLGEDAGFGPKGVHDRQYSAAYNTNAMGVYCGFNFGVGYRCNMPLGSTIVMETFYLTNKQLAPNETYGDSSEEIGAMIFGSQNVPNRTTCLGSYYGPGQLSESKKYAIRAVPEPGTTVVLVAGIVAIIRKRHRA